MKQLLADLKSLRHGLTHTLLGKLSLVVAGLAAIGLVIWGYIVLFPNLAAPVKVYDVIKLNKNWTDEERQKYYHTSQGSQVMPYDWFVALEQPNSRELFMANDYITGMRFIPDPNLVSNPSLLPIGFAKDDPDPVDGVQNVGLTCALCHTSQITYRGMGIRIDGAPGYFSQRLFVYERAGEACRVCKSPVRLFVQGQRSTYWCSTCQR